MAVSSTGWSSGDKTMEVLQDSWPNIALKVGKFSQSKNLVKMQQFTKLSEFSRFDSWWSPYGFSQDFDSSRTRTIGT